MTTSCDTAVPSRGVCFGEPPKENSSAQLSNSTSETHWSINGVPYTIPPLYDQMHDWATPPSFSGYAQRMRALKGSSGSSAIANSAMHKMGNHSRAISTASSSSTVTVRRDQRLEMIADGIRQEEDGGRGVLANSDNKGDGPLGDLHHAEQEANVWRRSWSVVVRRDILRQQRALVTQQREMLVTLKRSALALQKEVRKRALRAQRLASNPQVQVRCKRIARDIGVIAPTVEANLIARRAAIELASKGLESFTNMPRGCELGFTVPYAAAAGDLVHRSAHSFEEGLDGSGSVDCAQLAADGVQPAKDTASVQQNADRLHKELFAGRTCAG